MNEKRYAAPLLASEGVERPEWSGAIDCTLFEGLRESSFKQALEQLAQFGPEALKRWERDPHPPTVEIHPDAIAVVDGRHRMLAAATAGIDEMPVRVRVLDEAGALRSSYHQLAALLYSARGKGR